MNNTMFTTLLAAATRRNAPEPSPVRNGLVFWLDALNNTGHGLDTTATSWVDLIGGNNVPINLDYVSWQDNMCLQTADNYSAARSPNAIFTENGSYSFEAVVKFASPDQISWIAQIRLGNENYCQAYISNGRKIGCRCGTSSTVGISTVTVASLVVSVDFATGAMATYVNGVRGSSDTADSPSRPMNAPFQAFAQTTAGAYSVVGSGIFAVHVYDRVLTADEVAENYAYAREKYGI